MHIEADAFNVELVAIGQAQRDHIGLGVLAHHGHAAGPVPQRTQPGDVVGMEMGVDRLDEAEIEFIHELKVTVHLFQNRVDDERLGPLAAGDEIAVGARHTVEKLAKDHCRPPDGASPVLPGMVLRFPRGYSKTSTEVHEE